jgi:hypothetical protein
MPIPLRAAGWLARTERFWPVGAIGGCDGGRRKTRLKMELLDGTSNLGYYEQKQ